MNKFEDALMDLENAANEAIKADYPFWDDPFNVTAKQALTIAAAVEKNKDELRSLVDAGLSCGKDAHSIRIFQIQALGSGHIIKDILGAMKDD